MKSEAEVKKMLEEIESDERLSYNTATVFENAPLALIQCAGRAQANVLRKVLGMPHNGFTKKV